MKKLSIIFAAAIALFGYNSCNKDIATDFDHFEIVYSLSTNESSRDCFDTDFIIKSNDAVIMNDKFNVISFTGNLNDNKITPNSTISILTNPKFVNPMPSSVVIGLKYEITVNAYTKSGTISDSETVKVNLSDENPIALDTPESQKAALDLYTINLNFKTYVSEDKVMIEQIK